MDEAEFTAILARLRRAELLPHQARALRKVVTEKVCHYCRESPGNTRDHIVPRSRGGPSTAWNLVPACARCNYLKADNWPTCTCEKCVRAAERVRGASAVGPADPARGERPVTATSSDGSTWALVTIRGADGSRWRVYRRTE